MVERRKIRRTDDRDICFMEADPVQLWAYGIVEFKIDTRDRKFIVTAILRDGSEAFTADVTELYEQFLRERR
jgi:hypothetical protein